jgi:hypothetical protein
VGGCKAMGLHDGPGLCGPAVHLGGQLGNDVGLLNFVCGFDGDEWETFCILNKEVDSNFLRFFFLDGVRYNSEVFLVRSSWLVFCFLLDILDDSA